jgi:zinc D-Ala-D-Ala carboxypeptidase
VKVSPHFTLSELTRTDVPRFQVVNTSPPPGLMAAAKALCETLLEPIREHFGKPVIIHSAYRCPGLNAHIGGAKSSQHMKFEAADFHIVGEDLSEVWAWIGYKSGLKYGQCILEGGSLANPTWIHISLGAPWRPEKVSGQLLKFDGKRYLLP